MANSLISNADLSELFGQPQSYRFQMGLQHGSLQEFFGLSPRNGSILAERRRWLEETPAACVVATAAANEPLREFAALLSSLPGALKAEHVEGISIEARCGALGRALEPDFLFLTSEQGQFRVQGGCVCFPSSWSLSEKVGRALEFVHAPVPGLNEQLAGSINQFLNRLKPGIVWKRKNWGLSRSSDLNQHPARGLPRLDSTITVSDVWVRIEDQALLLLPESAAIVFGIRVRQYPLAEVAAEPILRLALRRALETMPEEVAVYKNLSGARARLLHLLA